VNNTELKVYIDNNLVSPTITQFDSYYLVHVDLTFSTHNIVIRFADLQAPIVTVNSPINYGLYPSGSTTRYNFVAVDNIDPQPIISATLTDWNGISLPVTSGSSLPTASGVYTLNVKTTDKSGNSASQNLMFIIYDPNGGFVTGGGWIQSPTGAYAANPSLSGKAEFGFVSKYQKGAQVPTGNTDFQFQVANFKFKSTSYEWLVVAGTKAQFKGLGTINGLGNYGFILTVEDAGNKEQDTFRIKIFDVYSEAKIYDNGAQNPIGGGNIVIHK
jgi:hypothetical protein